MALYSTVPFGLPFGGFNEAMLRQRLTAIVARKAALSAGQSPIVSASQNGKSFTFGGMGSPGNLQSELDTILVEEAQIIECLALVSDATDFVVPQREAIAGFKSNWATVYR